MNLSQWLESLTQAPLNSYTNFPALTLALGVAILLAGFIIGALALARRAHGRGPAVGLAEGAAIGLAGGAVSALSLAFSESLLGGVFWTFASGATQGLLMGVALAALVGAAVWALLRRNDIRLWGALIGLALGLAVFRLSGGASAGYGPELDYGFGPEVGLLFGLAGLLLGALFGALAGPRANWRFPTVGALIGAALGGLVAWVGYATGAFVFILPYFGGVTDRQPYPTPPYLVTLGIVYGFALFIIGGALAGAVIGAFATPTGSRLTGALTGLGLLLGALLGLNAGLQHGDVGGPPAFALQQVYDPVATGMGLLGGLAIGLVVVTLGWLTWRWAGAQPGRRALLGAVGMLALGLIVAALPLWFHPLIGADIP